MCEIFDIFSRVSQSCLQRRLHMINCNITCNNCNTPYPENHEGHYSQRFNYLIRFDLPHIYTPAFRYIHTIIKSCHNTIYSFKHRRETYRNNICCGPLLAGHRSSAEYQVSIQTSLSQQGDYSAHEPHATFDVAEYMEQFQTMFSLPITQESH